MTTDVDTRRPPAGPRLPGRWVRPGAGPLGPVLGAVSFADVATTGLALSIGSQERSPGGAVVLAAAGLAGLVVLKLLAMILVWALRRGWPPVGVAVGWGLAGITAGAVAWNLSVLSRAVPVS